MGYGYDGYDLPCIKDYEEAKRFFENTKPIRGHDVNTVPLESRKKTGVCLSKRPNGDYVAQLWRTDIIAYHPDNSITFMPAYLSMSTDRFAQRLTRYTPYGPRFAYGSPMIEVSGKHYNTPKATRWKDGKPLVPCEPFSWYTLNIKRANAAYKTTRLKEFTVWLKMVVEMGYNQEENNWNQTLNKYDAAAMLADQTQWTKLINGCWSAVTQKDVARIIKGLRDDIKVRERACHALGSTWGGEV